jgi:hypothetical protein
MFFYSRLSPLVAKKSQRETLPNSALCVAPQTAVRTLVRDLGVQAKRFRKFCNKPRTTVVEQREPAAWTVTACGIFRTFARQMLPSVTSRQVAGLSSSSPARPAIPYLTAALYNN